MALISQIRRLIVSVLHYFLWFWSAKPWLLQFLSTREIKNSMAEIRLPPFNRSGHIAHAKRCISTLPKSQTLLDASRLALAFYNLGILDLLGEWENGTVPLQWQKDGWTEWLWAQQAHGKFGSGFRPSPFMTFHPPENRTATSEYDAPHVIMTYTALLSLAILRDDFSKLDRPGLITLLRTCQREDGSFTTTPWGNGENDIRTLYCAFVISVLLDDWSGIDVERAKAFIASCRTYEGGYGQAPFCEAQGGTTYIALASLYLVPSSAENDPLTPIEKAQTIRWLVSNQAAVNGDDVSSGGFSGRTGKIADSCYCFWCGAALKILKQDHLIETKTISLFLSKCQFKYGGISKCQGEHSDPYHTYLSIAALCMYPPSALSAEEKPESWKFPILDPFLNARMETAEWAKKFISVKGQ